MFLNRCEQQLCVQSNLSKPNPRQTAQNVKFTEMFGLCGGFVSCVMCLNSVYAYIFI